MHLSFVIFYAESEKVSRNGSKDSDEEADDVDVPLLFIVIFVILQLLLFHY